MSAAHPCPLPDSSPPLAAPMRAPFPPRLFPSTRSLHARPLPSPTCEPSNPGRRRSSPRLGSPRRVPPPLPSPTCVSLRRCACPLPSLPCAWDIHDGAPLLRHERPDPARTARIHGEDSADPPLSWSCPTSPSSTSGSGTQPLSRRRPTSPPLQQAARTQGALLRNRQRGRRRHAGRGRSSSGGLGLAGPSMGSAGSSTGFSFFFYFF